MAWIEQTASMADLQPLRAGHGPELYEFEVANRAYFSQWISDRGDAYFEHFDDQLHERLAEQEAGACAFYVLVDPDRRVIGRFNMVGIDDGAAELGYRVAQRVAGRGVATSAVQEICRVAASHLGLHTLRARVSHDNVGSQRVLIKAGFAPAGEADVAGRPGTWYRRDLVVEQRPPGAADAAGLV